MPRRKLIVAHRGAISARVHENSVAAFERAIALGADMIEFDVRRTRDGTLIIHHDESIGNLEIAQTVFSDLKDAAAQAGIELATLEDIVRCAQGRIQLDVELKETGYESEVLNLLLQSFGATSLRITSFHISCIKSIKALEPRILAGLLVENVGETEIASLYLQASADFLAPHYRVLEPAARVAGRLFVWGADDDDALLTSLRHPKVTAIITNRPKIALALQEARNQGR